MSSGCRFSLCSTLSSLLEITDPRSKRGGIGDDLIGSGQVGGRFVRLRVLKSGVLRHQMVNEDAIRRCDGHQLLEHPPSREAQVIRFFLHGDAASAKLRRVRTSHACKYPTLTRESLSAMGVTGVVKKQEVVLLPLELDLRLFISFPDDIQVAGIDF